MKNTPIKYPEFSKEEQSNLRNLIDQIPPKHHSIQLTELPKWAVVQLHRERIPCRLSVKQVCGQEFLFAELIRSNGSVLGEEFINPSQVRRISAVDELTAKQMCDRLNRNLRATI